MAIDITRADRLFTAVVERARTLNDWTIDAVCRTDDYEGVVLFYRPEHPVEIAYGTAQFHLREDGNIITFNWGHYDLTREDARRDFARRCERGH